MKAVKEEIKIGGLKVETESKNNTRALKELEQKRIDANFRKKYRLKLFLVAALFSFVLVAVGCDWFISIIPLAFHFIVLVVGASFALYKKREADKRWKKYEKKYGVRNEKGEIEIPRHVQMTHRKLMAEGKSINVD